MMAVATGSAFSGADLPEESPGLWLAVVESVPDLLLLVDRDGGILYMNRLPPGVLREQVHGTSVFDYVSAESGPELRQSLRQIFTGGEARARVLPGRHPDGSIRWYSIHTGPVNRDGRVIAATIVARDVTDRKLAEAALRESEERYRTLIEHAPEAIVVLDVDTCQFVDVNRNACDLFGMARESLLGSDPVKLSPPAQPDGRVSELVAFERINEALNGGSPAFEWVHRTPAGVDLRCDVRLVRLPAEGRRLVRGSVTDVTRQRLLEEHIQQRQKLEALGQLAGGIAHDFNNILAVISASAELMLDGLCLPPDRGEELTGLREAIERGGALTRQLLTFARPQPTQPERLDLNTIVKDEARMLGPLLGSRHSLILSLDPSGAPVCCDRTQLEQVLMNLVLNACDAMAEGGCVTIETRQLQDVRGPVVRLRVEDSGVGMDETTRQRAFEPFFTTKAPEKGTGLGLSTVYMIVKQAGGRVQVASTVGAGSTFDVLLPVAENLKGA